jgi:glycerol-3-phosphate dehydrogenase
VVTPLAGDAALAARVVPDLPVVLGQVAHAVREEMAVHLWDVVRRRTPLYLSRALDRSALSACASVMARELRWSPRKTAAEIAATEAELVAFGRTGASGTPARGGVTRLTQDGDCHASPR